MGTRIHTAHALEVNVMTELDADGYFGGYPGDLNDDSPQLDGLHYRLLAFEDPGNQEAWVWRTSPRQLANLITRLQTIYGQIVDREHDIAAADRPYAEPAPVALDGDPGDLGDAYVAGDQ